MEVQSIASNRRCSLYLVSPIYWLLWNRIQQRWQRSIQQMISWRWLEELTTDQVLWQTLKWLTFTHLLTHSLTHSFIYIDVSLCRTCSVELAQRNKNNIYMFIRDRPRKKTIIWLVQISAFFSVSCFNSCVSRNCGMRYLPAVSFVQQ